MEPGLPGRTQLAGPGPAGQGARAPLGHWDGNGVKLSQELGCCYASALGRALFIALLPWLSWVNFAVCAWPCCLSDLACERNYLGRQEDTVYDSLVSLADRNRFLVRIVGKIP